MPKSLLPDPGAMAVQLQRDRAELLTEWMGCLPDYGGRVLYVGIAMSCEPK